MFGKEGVGELGKILQLELQALKVWCQVTKCANTPARKAGAATEIEMAPLASGNNRDIGQDVDFRLFALYHDHECAVVQISATVED
ncbi:hypothetical protein HYQ46_012184 [Verticillium longisporum]|nr:hypothetical protein HYQ46_012184 [Verticillium longisporum]